MLIIIIRTLLIYIVVTFAVRLMGKRQVGDMQTSELVITMIISETASLPLENPERPLLSGIIPVLMLAAIEILVSVIMMKSRKARGIIRSSSSATARSSRRSCADFASAARTSIPCSVSSSVPTRAA